MKCNPKLTTTEVANIMRDHKLANLFSGKAESQIEAINRLELIQRTFETKEFKGKRGYGVVGETAESFFIGETFTSEGKRNFERTNKNAEKINESASSIAQRDTGTYIHEQLENIVNTLASSTYKDKVLVRPGNYKDLNTIKKESTLSTVEFEKLLKTAREIIDTAIKTQKEKDPEGKVYIATEQRLLASTILGGTADIVFVYSDVTAGHLDYKTMVPKDAKYSKGKYRIDNPNWIPFYKYGDWNLQLPKTTFALENVIGIKNVETSRVIPIQLALAKNAEGDYTGKVKQIETFATAKDYLDQVPIQEKTGNIALDKTLDKLNLLKENMLAELDENITSKRKQYLKSRIAKLTKSVNAIIVKKDISAVIDDYQRVIQKYASFENKKYPTLKNIRDPKIDDEINPEFLTVKEHKELLNELSIISSVITGTYEFYNRMEVGEEEFAKYTAQIEKMQKNLGVLTNKLQIELYNRITLKTSTIKEFDNAKDIKYTSKLFNTFGEIQHPAFREAFERISKAESKATLDLQEYQKELKEVATKLETYSKSSGLGLFGAYNKLINKKTGNLYSQYNKEWYGKLIEAQKSEDIKFLDKYFKLKEDAEEKYENFLNAIVNKENWLNSDGTVAKSAEKDVKYFLKYNNLDKFKTNQREFWKYYELKPEYSNNLSQEIYSPEYINIQQTPALKEYYDFWIKSMRRFRKVTGMGNDYRALPDNFIPYYRASLIEKTLEGGLPKAAWEKFMGIFSMQSDDDEFGYMSELAKKRNIETGEVEHNISLFGINPLYNKEGVIDNELKSYDLTRVLYTFADISFNYENLKEIEAEVDVLGDMISYYGINQINYDGKLAKTLAGGYSKITGQQLELLKTYRNHIKYRMYGIKEQGELLSKEFTKGVTAVNNFQRVAQLGLEPVVQASATIAAKIAQRYEGKKGYYFTNKQAAVSDKMVAKALTEEGKLTSAIMQYFEFHGKHTNIKANELPDNKLIKLANKGLFFLGFRKGSEFIDNSIGLSMMQNYGINENGKIKRLAALPEGTKSLLESASLKDGKLEIEGITLENYNQFVNMVRRVSRGIKGELSQNDQRAINFTVLGKLAMTYKSWLPDLYKEHFNGIEYNNYTDAVTIGRFNAIYKNLLNDEDKKFALLNKGLYIGIGKLLLDIPLTFVTRGKIRLSKANEQRARMLFEKFKQDNMADARIQEFTFEEFLDYYDGQIKAGIHEMQMYLGLILFLMMAGGADWDDDGVEDYKQYMVMNIAYRTLNRAKREIGFFLGSEGIDIALKTSLPVTGVLLDLKRSMENFVDEAYHDITGKKDPYDKSGYFHYASKQIPIINPIRKFIDKDRKF